MTSQAIQAQWSIDQSAKSVISIARAAIQAATTDNVQVLALIACEKFGATLAICQESRLKVEKLVLPTPKPAIIKFLQATVGYSENDCASALGRSYAGIQFLALATALVTSMPPFESAGAIQAMLLETAVDQTLIPTITQIQDLLMSIEPRCSYAGIMEDVVGWQILFSRASNTEGSGSDTIYNESFPPDTQGIKNLVSAFRQLQRIGDADISGTTIRSPFYSASWITAFVKWCLGSPPAVILEGVGTILSPTITAVTLVVSADSSLETIQVTLHSNVQNPTELVVSTVSDTCASGMIPIAAYGQRLLEAMNFDNDLAQRTLKQVVPYALRQVVENLFVHDSTEFDTIGGHTQLSNWKKGDGPVLSGLRMSPFPDDVTISEMHRTLFGYEKRIDFRSLEEGLLISDLPLLKVYLKHLQETCLCKDCKGDQKDGINHWVSVYDCQKRRFAPSFHYLIAAILCLSIFKFPGNLQVSSVEIFRGGNTHAEAFLLAISNILASGEFNTCTSVEFLETALEFVGHLKPLEVRFLNRGTERNTAHTERSYKMRKVGMTCFHGQAIWPSMWEHYTYKLRGSLSFSWHPGKIKFRDETYDMVDSSKVSPKYFHLTPPSGRSAVLEPCQLFADQHFAWTIDVQERAILNAHVGVAGLVYPVFSPMESIHFALCHALLVERCSHDPKSKLAVADRFTKFTGPLDPFGEMGDYDDSAETRRLRDQAGEDGLVCVVPVDASNELRFLAMAAAAEHAGQSASSFADKNSYRKVVVRKHACLQCCLEVCRKAGSRLLIL